MAKSKILRPFRTLARRLFWRCYRRLCLSRVLSALLAGYLPCFVIAALVLPCLVPQAAAADVPYFSAAITYQELTRGWSTAHTGSTSPVALPWVNRAAVGPINGDEAWQGVTFYDFVVRPSENTTGTQSVSGAVGLYASFYGSGYSTKADYAWYQYGTPAFTGYVRLSDSSTAPASVTVDQFTANGTDTYVSPGYRVSLKYTADEGNPVVGLGFERSRLFGWYLNNNTTASSRSFRIMFPSVRVVASETSADLEALEGIADSIAAQSQVLSAMYGDIMAILQQIYSRNGDILATQQQANVYFQQVIAQLAALGGKLDAINSTETSIYALLSQQFQLLIDTINSGVVSIEDAIAMAELRLENYLKPVIDYFNSLEETTGESAATLPGHKTDLDSAVSSSSGLSEDALDGFSSVWSLLSGFEVLLIMVGLWLGAGIVLIVIKKGLS